MILVLIGVQIFTLVCAWNIGRLHAQTKILKFLSAELKVNQNISRETLAFIEKLVKTL